VANRVTGEPHGGESVEVSAKNGGAYRIGWCVLRILPCKTSRHPNAVDGRRGRITGEAERTWCCLASVGTPSPEGRFRGGGQGPTSGVK